MVNRRTTDFVAEGNTAYYICNATIPVSSFLVWKREDNKTVPAMKLITPLNSIAHDMNNLCQAYAKDRYSETISLTINNSSLYTLEGLVSRQTIVLVICNMKSSMVGVYQCVAQSSMGEATSGPQISIDILPSASSPSHNNHNMLVPYLIMSCVLIGILLLVALLVIVIGYFWLRHQSKQLKSSGTVMHRKREENIYFDARPRMTKEH